MADGAPWWRRVWDRVTGVGRVGGGRIVSSGRSAGGVYVDAETALKNATVWACIQYLSKTVAQLPWRVLQDKGAAGNTPMPTNPADWLLHRRPNPEMGAFTFRQTLVGWALRYGNGYAEIEWDQRGAPYALWPIHPNRVEPRRDDAGGLFYRVHSLNGGFVDMDAADMFHVRGFGDGVVGLNVMEFAAESIGWAQATALFGASFFGQGMNPSGIVETTGKLTPEGLELLKKDMAELYQGPRAKRTMFLDNGMKFTKVSVAPDESQFIETAQHLVPEICRWFGVPPHKVMHLLQATFSNIEHQSIEVVVDCITPWARVFEEEANWKFFGARNPQNLYTKMDLRALLRGDHTSRANYYKALFGMGVLSVDEIRELEDMNPIGEAGGGHNRFVPLNMVPLQLAADPSLQRGAGGPPSEPDPADDGADPRDPQPPANRRPLPN